MIFILEITVQHEVNLIVFLILNLHSCCNRDMYHSLITTYWDISITIELALTRLLDTTDDVTYAV